MISRGGGSRIKRARGIIPELRTDPPVPGPNSMWVLATSSGGGYTYQLSYGTPENTIERTTLV